MRYDMRVLWVEDTPKFYKETKDILEMFAEDMGLVIDFKYIQNVEEFMQNIGNEKNGFKLFDIYFIDYTLSNGVVGDSVIKELRKEEVDADVLFYSSEHERDIRSTIIDDLNSFQGVYIANRDNFEEKSTFLLKKNARRLLALNNIRGLLMDQTSENDYTVNSYILRKFDELTTEQKISISKMLEEYISKKSNELGEQIPEVLEKLKTTGITNIKKTMGLSSYLFPIDLKYRVFQKIMDYLGEESFSENSLDTYLDKTVKERNKLAHKKLELCKTQQYILYYDTIDQKENRKCPDDCEQHTDQYKISVQEWKEIRKNVIAFGKCFDAVQDKL